MQERPFSRPQSSRDAAETGEKLAFVDGEQTGGMDAPFSGQDRPRGITHETMTAEKRGKIQKLHRRRSEAQSAGKQIGRSRIGVMSQK